jgi:hypothetical protein
VLQVSAGPDQATPLAPGAPAYEAELAGTVLVDGLPPAPGAVTLTWSLVSGPGGVAFTDPAAAQTTATFAASGVHVLELEADDGVDVVTDQVEVTVDLLAATLTTQNLRPAAGAASAATMPALEVVCPGEGTPLEAVEAEYLVAADPGFTTILHASGFSENDVCGHVVMPALPEETELYWSARRRDTTGAWSAWSTPTSFTTIRAGVLTTVELQGDLNGYTGAADADIRGSWADPTKAIRNWNQGAQDVLRTGRRPPNQSTDEIYRSLLRFDLSGVASDPETVVGVHLELTGWMHSDDTYFLGANSFYELLVPWGEGTGIIRRAEEGEVSWKWPEYPVEWTVPGAAGIGADREGDPLMRAILSNSVGHKHYLASGDLTQAVREWVATPTSNFGVLLKADDEDVQAAMNLGSREHPDAFYRPKLVLQLTSDIACADGLDNDGDGLIDEADPGCADGLDDDELSTAACDNGVDDDGDGAADWPADVGCISGSGTTESPQCSDGVNNDPGRDAFIDFDGGAAAGLPPELQTAPDPDCVESWIDRENPSSCGLGFELVGVLPLLAALRRRRSAARALAAL